MELSTCMYVHLRISVYIHVCRVMVSAYIYVHLCISVGLSDDVYACRGSGEYMCMCNEHACTPEC